MYWESEDYKKIAKLVIDIFIDYEIKNFPIDANEMCNKLGFKLLTYKETNIDPSNISDDAFYISATKDNPPIIIYNSDVEPRTRIRFSIFHEIKHCICGDKGEYEDKLKKQYIENMADYFAKYMMCPIPILIYREVNDIETIMSDYDIGEEAANYVLDNLNNRRKKYGNKIFDYEMPLINMS